jgi:predicted enzyme related to lactoylglutathione lyase
MITHVGITTVYVSDQEKAIDFYTNTLGFELRANDAMGDMRWVEVAPKGATTRIVLARGFGGWSEDKVGQFTGLGLVADDVEATYRELSAKGVEFTEKPNQQPWGMQAQFVDQDGNGYVLGDRS